MSQRTTKKHEKNILGRFFFPNYILSDIFFDELNL